MHNAHGMRASRERGGNGARLVGWAGRAGGGERYCNCSIAALLQLQQGGLAAVSRGGGGSCCGEYKKTKLRLASSGLILI